MKARIKEASISSDRQKLEAKMFSIPTHSTTLLFTLAGSNKNATLQLVVVSKLVLPKSSEMLL